MEPIRILQVLASLDRGGAETMIMNIYRNIDRNKIQFDFVVNESEKEYAFESEIIGLGGRIFKVPRFSIINYLFYRQSWKKLLKEHPEWKVIHGHHTSPAFIYLQVAKSLNRTTIAHSHIAGVEKRTKSLIKVFMRFPIRFLADNLFACSGKAANWMFGKKYSSSTQIINNAVNVKEFIFDNNIKIAKRKELGIDDKFVIGHIGRFEAQKNHEYLIDIFKAVHEKNDKAILMLIGDGELRSSIEKKVNDLGLTSSVIFTGIRTDIPELLQAMDVFVFPSLYEGLPVTLIEAQASGLPCVISDTISDEVSVTSLVRYISIKDNVETWASKILDYSMEYNRYNTSTEIKENGYDVEENVKWIQEFYLEKVKAKR